jgi:hypothetical protein
LYAAWKAIFDAARPTGAESPRSSADQRTDTREKSSVPAQRPAVATSQTATARAFETHAANIRTGVGSQRAPVLADISDAASGARAGAVTRQNVSGEVVPLTRKFMSVAACEAADVGVRVHYLDADTAQSAGGPQFEVVSIVLEGAQVSIIVRNGELSETEALRAAFQTARELTGRSASLQQLTLNGRVLYEQAVTDHAPSGILFA